MMNRRGRSAVATVVVVAGLAWPAVVSAQTASPPPPPLPSAIGDERPMQIVVSPAYARTHIVLAVASSNACNCVHLWISRDAGVTWQRAAATGWSPGRLSPTVDHAGHEVLFTAGNAGLERSDDLGTTWTTVGIAGMATPSPGFADDGLVAVAGTHDYVLRTGSANPVTGSAGRFTDYEFLLAPGYPGGGSYAPALLSAYDTHSSTAQVLRCTASLSCSTPVPLAGPPLTGAPLLFPSTAYRSDGTVFALMAANLYKSSDGGATFTPLSVGQPADVTGTNDLALDSTYQEHGADRIAYAAIVQWNTKVRGHTFGGVYRSADGGASWARLGTGGPLDYGASAVAVTPDGRVLAGYQQPPGSGLVCWTGSAWTAACAATAATAAHNVQCTTTSCPRSTPAATAHADAAAAGAITPQAGPTAPPVLNAVARRDVTTSSGGRRTSLIVATVVLLLLGAAAAARTALQRRTSHRTR